ncbi:DNA repair protein [Streptococcus moroccensis]|uniref:DNA repair protein n=1 Tax=Streptococcus moroccensis TaxID=1451356 RepID=A0ABT9YWJ0_9STRE|nr:DNA repair protein [Streptococcus moroccensis]MDQ0223430.1 hypothetical protein [Streptococcus moroccensis]
MELKKLKRLKREQLLELMLNQQQTIESQADTIKKLEELVEQKEIKLNEVGSIAEASLALNGVFEAAQAAADQYLLSIKAMYKDEKRNE